jgi:N-acetylneuraminate lyase
MDKIRGIFSALITPMHSDESVDYGMLATLVEYEYSKGVEGFYCCGSSGEALLLSLEERKKITRTVLKAVAGRLPVIAHVGTIRTMDAIELAADAMSAGASAVSMIPPYYYKFTQEEIIGYYEDIILKTQAPIIIYNIPQFTGIAFTKDNARRLLENPKVVGVKHTSQDLFALERMQAAYPDKIYYNGFDEMYLPALAIGADSAIGTTVNLFASRFIKIRNLYGKGDFKGALVEQEKVNRGVELLVRHGIFNGVKHAFTTMGYPCGSCRAPFRPLTDKARLEIESMLQYLLPL